MSKLLFALLVTQFTVGMVGAQAAPSVQSVCETWRQDYFRNYEERQEKNQICASARSLQEVCEIWEQYIDPIPAEQQGYDSVCNRPQPTQTPSPTPTPTLTLPGIGDKLRNWWNTDRNWNDLREITFTPWLVVNEPPFVIRAPALVVVVAGTALTLVSVALAELFVKSHRNLKALERVEGELKDVGPRVKELENERNELRNKVIALEKTEGELNKVRPRVKDLEIERNELRHKVMELNKLEDERKEVSSHVGMQKSKQVELQQKVSALVRMEGELKKARLLMSELESERDSLRQTVKALEMRFGEHKEVRSRMRVQVSERTQRFPQTREREHKSKNHNTVGWDALRIYSKSRGELQAYGLYKGYPKNWSEISERLRKDHPQCSNCNFRKEEGNPLQVHHLNGVPADCRTENLQVLCEVCHKRMHGKSPFRPWKHRSL